MDLSALHAELFSSRTQPPIVGDAEAVEFAHLPGIDRLRGNLRGDIPPPPSWFLLGWRLTEVEEGRVSFIFEPLRAHASYGGTVHGGILSALADSAMGCATVSLLPADSWCAVAQMNVHYARRAFTSSPSILAVGKVRRSGRGIFLVEAVLTQGDREVVVASSSYVIHQNRRLPGQPPP